jgi:hypothetical protein
MKYAINALEGMFDALRLAHIADNANELDGLRVI